MDEMSDEQKEYEALELAKLLGKTSILNDSFSISNSFISQ